MKLFKRRMREIQETAPIYGASALRTFQTPGIPPAGLPYSTYDLMEQDAMVQTALTIKKLGVLAPGFKIEPGDSGFAAQEAAKFVERALDRIEGSAATILSAAMDSFSKGWSIQEKVFESDGDAVWLAATRPKDPADFGLDLNEFGQVLGLRVQLPGGGWKDVEIDKFVVHVNRPSYKRPKGRSDLDAAWRHWAFKTQLNAGWKTHPERFAMPTLLGKYDRGLPVSEQRDLLAALQDLQSKTAIMYPSEVTIDTLGGKKEASTGFMEALEFHNREIARAILGQTLTTDEGRRVGSLALGKVHLQVLLLQLDAIRKSLADSVMTEQVIRPLVEMNFGDVPLPRFTFNAVALDAFATGAG